MQPAHTEGARTDAARTDAADGGAAGKRAARATGAGDGWAGRSWERLHGFGPVAGLVLLCIAGTLLNSDFATVDNAMNVLTRTAFIGIIAVGMCFVIISGGIDLSVGWVMSLASVLSALAIRAAYNSGAPLFLAALAGLGAALAGAELGQLLLLVGPGVALAWVEGRPARLERDHHRLAVERTAGGQRERGDEGEGGAHRLRLPRHIRRCRRRCRRARGHRPGSRPIR